MDRQDGGSDSTATPVIIRASGKSYKAYFRMNALVAAAMLGALVIGPHRAEPGFWALMLGMMLIPIGLMAWCSSLRVELRGDAISYSRLFRATQTLRRGQIASAGPLSIEVVGRGFYRHFLAVRPTDREIRPMRIRTDFFLPSDVRAIRDFLGEASKAPKAVG